MTYRRGALSSASLFSIATVVQTASRGPAGQVLYKTGEARIKPPFPRTQQKRSCASVAASRQVFLSGALTAKLSSPQRSSLVGVNFFDPAGGRGKFSACPPVTAVFFWFSQKSPIVGAPNDRR